MRLTDAEAETSERAVTTRSPRVMETDCEKRSATAMD